MRRAAVRAGALAACSALILGAQAEAAWSACASETWGVGAHDGRVRNADALQEIGNWPFGQSLAVEEDPDRDIAYVGSGGAVLILDIRDLTDPELVSDAILSEGLVVDLAYDAARQLLFLACGIKGLEIWDVRDPSDPTRLYAEAVTNYGSEFPADNIEVSGNFVILNSSALRVLDVTDPAHPVHAEGSTATRSGIDDLYLDEDGRLHGVGSDGYFRFSVLSSGYLQIDAAYEPPEGGGFSLVAASLAPDVVYVDRGSSIWIVDPEDPYFPVLSTFSTGQNKTDIDYQNGYLSYVKGFNRELHIWNVSDVYSPYQESVLPLPGGANRLEVVGDHVYIADGYSGLVIIDASDPAAPVEIGEYDTLGRNSGVALYDHYAYLAEHDDGVLVIDIADPTEPVLVGQYDTPGWSYGVFVRDDLLYVADWDGGLRICDLTDPADPALIGVGSVAQAWSVAVSGGYAYVVDAVVDGLDTIRVLDVSDPAAPTEVGSRLMSNFVDALDTTGDYLYAACHEDGLKVLDISAHGDPIEVNSYPLTECTDVDIQGDCAYAVESEWDGGLYTFDIADPANPVYVSNYALPAGLRFSRVSVEGLFAYVTVPTSNRVYVLFLGDPEHPVEIDDHETPGSMPDLLAGSGHVYVADGSAGLRILENDLYYSPGADVAWEVLDSGVTAHLRGVHFSDETHGCAAGDYGTVLTTENGGDTWTQRSSGTGEDLFGVFFVDPDTGWVGGRDGVLRKTMNGGESWEPQSSGTTGQIRGIEFVTTEVGWAVGGDAYSGLGFILKTVDGGEHWQSQPTGGAALLMAASFVDELHGWACGNDGVVLRTVDGGASWGSADPPTISDVNDVSFVDAHTGWICTSETSVYKTTDGGDDWTLQTDESAPYSTFNSIAFVDALTGWVAGGVGLGGHTYGTTDGGFSWKEIQGSHEYYLQSICFLDREHGWAVGHDGWILRTAPLTTGVADEPGDSAGAARGPVLLPASPNPFNPTTRIAFELSAESDVTLVIYDTAGQVVRTLVAGRAGAGLHVVPWDGRSDSGEALASGVYLSELRARGDVRRGKLTLLK
jgi:hypothetical protein